jgi:hypothetical protein
MGVRVARLLRVLPFLAVCLVAAGAAAIGIGVASTAGGFVMRQADDVVRACASSVLSHGPVTVPGYDLVAVPGYGLVAVSGSGLVAAPGPGLVAVSGSGRPGLAGSGSCGVELVSASGQVLIPAASAAGGPAVPASGSWLAAHLAGTSTVPGAGGGRWQAVVTAVHYQAQRMLFVFGPDDLRYVISGRTGHGASGMLIVMAGLAGTGQVAVGYAAVAGTVLVLLAAAAFALTRAVLRPLRAAEAAAHRRAANMSGQLAETCLQLRRPVSVVYGFSGYLRQQKEPRTASIDRMLGRVTDEITRMEMLIDGLHMPSASEPGGPDRQPR